jgi:type VI secretion system secreted protein Hcp
MKTKERIMRGFGVLGILAALTIGAPGAWADIFLRLDGVNGEATASGFQNQIMIDSFEMGGANTATAVRTGGASATKVQLKDLVLKKALDLASPTLFLMMASGKTIPNAQFAFRTTGENAVTYYKVTLTNVMITGIKQQGSSTARPTEEVTFNYGTITFEYYAVKSTGGLGKSSVSGWDLTRNQKL